MRLARGRIQVGRKRAWFCFLTCTVWKVLFQNAKLMRAPIYLTLFFYLILCVLVLRWG